MMATGMRTRTVVLIGLAALAVGWLAGSTTASREAQSQSTAPRGPRPLGSAPSVTPYTEQLRLRLQAQPRSPEPGRNPFVFGSRRPLGATARRATDVESAASAAEPVPVPAARPRFVLSGIASDIVAGSTIYTGILTDNGVLTFVMAGQALAGGYTVASVDELSVVLVDSEGREHVLRLK
jgi:hypothetical protein